MTYILTYFASLTYILTHHSMGRKHRYPTPILWTDFDYIWHDMYHHPKLLPEFEARAFIFRCVVASKGVHPRTHIPLTQSSVVLHRRRMIVVFQWLTH
jgi:hypothetical protein